VTAANLCPPPAASIVIMARDSRTVLLKVFENGEGKLDAEYDPANLTKAAQGFAEALRGIFFREP